MWYSYYINSSGEWTKSKKFETLEQFEKYVYKHPSVCFVASTSEPDFNGRAHSSKLNESTEKMKNK